MGIIDRLFGRRINNENGYDKIQSRINELNDMIVSNLSPVKRDQVSKRKIKTLGRFVKSKGLVTHFSTGNLDYEPPEFDLQMLTGYYTNDSYFMQAINKLREQVTRNGYNLVGEDEKTVDIVKSRLRDIKVATKIPFDKIIEHIAFDLLLYGNCFVYKRRSDKLSSGYTYTRFDGKRMKPIAGIFCVDPTNIQVVSDRYGNIKKYVQNNFFNSDLIGLAAFVPRLFFNTYAEDQEWNKDDMDHIKYNQIRGYLYGTPTGWPVLSDIRSIRMIEENMELITYQHGHPFVHAKVGTPEAPATREEVELAQQLIENMEGNGTLVTNERVEVLLKGIEGRQVPIEVYYTLLKNRTFSGMGVSSVLMGEGGTTNKSTAVTIDKIAQTKVVDIQNEISNYVTNTLFDEILLEAGYKYHQINESNRVELKFPEIDPERKTIQDNNTVQLWLNNLLSFNEARKEIGKPPLNEYSNQFYNEVVKVPMMEKEGELGIQLQKATNKMNANSNEVENKARPTNQHGTKAGRTQPQN